MTSYVEYTCEHAECAYTWIGYYLPEHICPECSGQQFRNGEIFEYLKESLHSRVTPYHGIDIPDEAKDYLEQCHRCIADLEELRLVYESDSAYREGKPLNGFDSVGYRYHDLIRRQSFDVQLFDIPEFLLKHV